MDAYGIGLAVAEMVLTSQVLGSAHKNHHSAFGNHIFGKLGKHKRLVDAWAMCISPLVGIDPATDELIEQIKQKAEGLLIDVPKTTQIWDVGDRNIMLDEQGVVVGLVDQVDMFTGDAILVPGFSLAMLGDVHHWRGWGITQEPGSRHGKLRLSSGSAYAFIDWVAMAVLLANRGRDRTRTVGKKGLKTAPSCSHGFTRTCMTGTIPSPTNHKEIIDEGSYGAVPGTGELCRHGQ